MRDWFTLKMERQFIFFISMLATLHLSFKLLDWPGQFAWLILIPFLFSLINLFSFIFKGFRKSIWEFKYFLILLLYLMISLKFGFRYYNILFSILLVAISIYVLKYKDFILPRLRHRLILLVGLNILLIVIPDIFVFKYRHSADNQIWGNKLQWDDFKGVEPENIGEMDAKIDSDIYWLYNRVYNIPRYITLTVMEESGSWVRPEFNDTEGNLLKHEQLHFDITEWTRREFRDSLYNSGKVNYAKAKDIYDNFQIVESKRHTEYDSISKHGIDFNGQIKWNKKVRLILN